MIEHSRLNNSICDLLARLDEDCLCYELVEKVRFPLGFQCRKCNSTQAYRLERGRKFQCKKCKDQCSLTAGTVFHGSKVPIRKWIAAVFYFGNSQGGISAKALQKLIFVSYKTARKMLKKIRKVMEDANERRFIDALFFKVKNLIVLKGIPTAQAGIFVQFESNGLIKVNFKEPTTIDNARKQVQVDPKDVPTVSKLVASSITHFNRLLLGTYHQYCLKQNFGLYVAEFVYRFNEPNPLRMVMKLLSDCLGVPFDERLAIVEEWWPNSQVGPLGVRT